MNFKYSAFFLVQNFFNMYKTFYWRTDPDPEQGHKFSRTGCTFQSHAICEEKNAKKKKKKKFKNLPGVHNDVDSKVLRTGAPLFNYIYEFRLVRM